MSQERFAARLGTTRRRVIAWEKGETTSPHPVYLQRIAELTGLTVDFFLAGGAIETSRIVAAPIMKDPDSRHMPLSRDEYEMLGTLMARLVARSGDAAGRPTHDETMTESLA